MMKQQPVIIYFLKNILHIHLAVSAKEELDNMGLSPEEILKRTETAKQ
ncbi:MAG: hypothetical protein MZV64_08040 [Ignavibacteriales bacterium]|nr:hypothetical protein [Ignavibacteriales bacterium]